MKKRIFLLAAAALLTQACLKDDRLNFMVNDSFGLTARSTVVEASIHTGSYSVGIAKNGIGSTAASVEIISGQADDKAALDAYNSDNGTAYKALPAYLYELSDTSLEYSEKEVVKEVTLTWDPRLVSMAMDSGDNYVIPLSISSGKLGVNDSHRFMMVHLNRSSVYVSQKEISRTVEAKALDGELKETITLDVNVSPAIKGMGMKFPVELGETDAPEGLVTILDNTASIPEGAMGGTFRISLDKSKLLDGSGTLVPFPDYTIQVCINTEGLTATLDGKDFGLTGLSYGNIVATVTVSYFEAPAGLSVRRLWGKYSTQADSWSSYLPGFTASAERNVAVDDSWVYIAETNTSKHLWAISVQDPGTYKLLPAGTVADNGIFYLSCPRVLKNTDPAINGGKDVLVVSNMIEGDPTLYFYSDGIDSEPQVVKATTWASRRLGDTFTYSGTLQDGVFFFKDFNSANGTVTFPLKFKPTTSVVYLVARLVAPAATGAGAFFPYPEDNGKGVSSLRSDTPAQLVYTDEDFTSKEGAVTPTLKDLPEEFYTNSAFRFFEFKGFRYIAYTNQTGTGSGTLTILKGEAAESWESILERHESVYSAAIQNDSENDALDTTASAMSSTHSGMDLDAYVTDDAVLIAVVKQNVGLSLFKLEYSD